MSAPEPPACLGPDEMCARIAAFAADALGTPRCSVRASGLRRMPGGSSRETWSLRLEIERAGGAPEVLDAVLRRDPPGRSGESDRGLEFRVLRAAAEAGVPVPRVHFCCSDPEVIGTPFFVMDRIPGETLPRRLLRDEAYADARARMTEQLAEILARIHRVPLEPSLRAALAAPTPGDAAPARAQLDAVAAGVRALAAEPHPTLDLAERWLRERLPPPTRAALVHGDYRIGNVVFDAGGARAILDWELAHVGDPVEDLGWLCTRAWRFGSELPVGGIGSRETLLAAYERAGGGAVDPEHLRFWEALGSFKVALVFIQQSNVYLSGRVRSLELASLGRRIGEAEAELIERMQDVP
ncbi:MAG: phosphotransferase family protein [Deltaproteobacteria bacterium]|nr:MAG: phosphotransferase family protein [Deltaproteobacteria bacterium]